MLIKNPSAKVSKLNRFVPYWTADGYKAVKAIALVAVATAKLPGALVMTSSGWGYRAFNSYSATGNTKFAVAMHTGASGDYIECAIEGYITGVSQSGTGTITTCYSTFTVGHVVSLTDTGHLIDLGATWTDAYWTCSSVQSTAASAVGIAMASGDDRSDIDLWVVGKPTIYCAAT